MNKTPGSKLRSRAFFISTIIFFNLTGGTGALAAGSDCPAIPRHFPMPREASAEYLASDDWKARTDALDKRLESNTNENPDVVFIGDSITEFWEPTLFRHFFSKFTTLNLGVASDFTQGTLWRLDHGQWGRLRPRLVVLLIGTNNLTYKSEPADLAMGVAEIVRFIHVRSSATKILILGVLPRGASPTDPIRTHIEDFNTRISKCADGITVFYADPGRHLLESDGSLLSMLEPDFIHLSPAGYSILGQILLPKIQSLLRSKR
jgi:beta-glucosidase